MQRAAPLSDEPPFETDLFFSRRDYRLQSSAPFLMAYT